jgi:hypothetical protein
MNKQTKWWEGEFHDEFPNTLGEVIIHHDCQQFDEREKDVMDFIAYVEAKARTDAIKECVERLERQIILISGKEHRKPEGNEGIYPDNEYNRAYNRAIQDSIAELKSLNNKSDE